MLKACESREEPIYCSSSVDHFVMDDTGYCFQADENGQEMLEKIRPLPRISGGQVTEILGGFLLHGGVVLNLRRSKRVKRVKGRLEVTWEPTSQKSRVSSNALGRIQPVADADPTLCGSPCWRICGVGHEKTVAKFNAFLLDYAGARLTAWEKTMAALTLNK